MVQKDMASISTEETFMELRATVDAISKVQAVIEFDLDGTVITANENFLSAVGYRLEEIQGKHHQIFVEEAYRHSRDYEAFWEKLRKGEFVSGEIKRIGRGGKELWLQASYNPILDAKGVPFKVIKFATDITEQKLQNADYQGQIEAISKAQAVIAFNLDGTIITANENFLSAIGYRLEEIQGKHHQLFVEPDYARSAEYRLFWESLNRGEFQAGEFQRVAKGGRTVWLQASYNPIFDMNGAPFKVVKYATDITEQKQAEVLFRQEMERVYMAIKAGNLSTRGDVKAMRGVYRVPVQNTNEIIEAIVEPVAEIQQRLAEVAQGDVKALVTGDYQGDHAALKNALNTTLYSLGELADAAERIATGDLTVEVNPKSKVDAMGHAMFQIVASLNEILGQVQQASEQIACGSKQVAQSSQSLAQGATEQASALVEISTSVAQTSSQTDKNADNADLASQLANTAREAAQLGDQQMVEMTGAMSAIEESSQSISKIIKVIDEIAFQTNLLALNAAVESARAGVHGKGFAVVANEVRNLAARSAKAAKETTQMIEDSNKKVRHGIEIANKTAEALAEIVSSIGKTTDLVKEISAASKEQAVGINQINQGLSQIEQVTQQNSADSEESAAAAEELSSQAVGLQKQLQRFKLKETARLPGGGEVTPEMLAMVQRYLEQQSG